MTPAQTNLRKMRFMHAVYLCTWFLFLFLLQRVKPVDRPVSLVVVGAVALTACAEIGIALSFRARLLTPALEILRTNPRDSDAMKRWRLGNVLSFACAETVTLFGFALRFFGATWNIAGGFFAAGLLLLLAWTPRLDVPSQ